MINIDYILTSYMPVINFSIPESLDKKINDTIRIQGFSSKAEFFRFSAMICINNYSEKEFSKTVEELKELISKKFAGKKLPTIEEQLADL